MESKIIPAAYFQPKSWSGGTTTELFIFPTTASYHSHNFQFRISTATVEIDKSDFSSLIGVSRKIMILRGKTILTHEGRYSKLLNKFDMDEFEGDWKTSSVGKCTDFNLMTKGNTSGTLSAMVVNRNHVIHYPIKTKCDWLFMYLYSGKISLVLSDKILTMNERDLLEINTDIPQNIKINGLENSELVFSEISKPPS